MRIYRRFCYINFLGRPYFQKGKKRSPKHDLSKKPNDLKSAMETNWAPKLLVRFEYIVCPSGIYPKWFRISLERSGLHKAMNSDKQLLGFLLQAHLQDVKSVSLPISYTALSYTATVDNAELENRCVGKFKSSC